MTCSPQVLDEAHHSAQGNSSQNQIMGIYRRLKEAGDDLPQVCTVESALVSTCQGHRMHVIWQHPGGMSD
jgi:hypothetical protein